MAVTAEQIADAMYELVKVFGKEEVHSAGTHESDAGEVRRGGGQELVQAAAFRSMGLEVRPYRRGADYIDAAWLTAAAGRPCRNLDTYVCGAATVREWFRETAAGADLAVVEGNRGLFDGLDAEGSCSSADLARLLSCPVVLVCDCAKATRTVAALVARCLRFDPAVRIGGWC